MDPERISTLMNMQVPTTKKQVKQVLGFFGYYRQYVNDFAGLAKPLTDLTSKNLPETITWTELEQNSFDALKLQFSKTLFYMHLKLEHVLVCIVTAVIGLWVQC